MNDLSKPSSPVIYTGTTSATSSPDSASGPSRSTTPDGAADLFGQPAVPAPRSAARAKKSPAPNVLEPVLSRMLDELAISYAELAGTHGLPTLGTYGQKSGDLPPSAILQRSLESKYQVLTDGCGSRLFVHQWKCWDMPLGGGDICAAGVGAPHIRQRLYFVADSYSNGRTYGAWPDEVPQGSERDGRHHAGAVGDSISSGLEGHAGDGHDGDESGRIGTDAVGPVAETGAADGTIGVVHAGGVGREMALFDAGSGEAPAGQREADEHRGGSPSGGVDDSDRERREYRPSIGRSDGAGEPTGERGGESRDGSADAVGMADASGAGIRRGSGDAHGAAPADGGSPGQQWFRINAGECGTAGILTGFWGNAEWLWCIDGKARPVEPGTFPLAHGAAARVGRLRGYGNALCEPQARAFIGASMQALGLSPVDSVVP